IQPPACARQIPYVHRVFDLRHGVPPPGSSIGWTPPSPSPRRPERLEGSRAPLGGRARKQGGGHALVGAALPDRMVLGRLDYRNHDRPDGCISGVTWERRRHRYEVMGTVFSFIVGACVTEAAVRAVEAELDRIDRLFSTYRPGSQIARLNAGRIRLGDCSPEV